MNAVKTIELNIGKVEIASDGILRFIPLPELNTVTLEQLESLLEVLIKITDGKPRPFYADNSKMKSLGFQERQFIGNNLHLFASASAVKDNSTIIRFIGHTINHLFPPKVPMQMFDSENEAIEWLKSLEE